MKTITAEIPDLSPLALVITSKSIGLEAEIMAADFRDSKSLYSRKLKCYFGFRPDIRITAIKPEFKLINGFWYAEISSATSGLPLIELDMIVKEWEW